MKALLSTTILLLNALPVILILLIVSGCSSQKRSGSNASNVRIINVDSGWANNSVNAVVFRKNSLATHNNTQYIAFYNAERFVVVGKRNTGSKDWQLAKTKYQGNTNDAHNMISLMVDGDGYLHLSWDHHNNALRYAKSVAPGSLHLSEKMPMTGKLEGRVSYPEFHRLPDGSLLFFYRDGGSGQGNLVINKYNLQTRAWTQLHANLIDGEKKRNPYWQACVDTKGTIHISWVWRESPDVASNHDMCYARSTDGGVTWEKTTGEKYSLPINATTAEYAVRIPQKSELINQTSMFADAEGNPYIASYWRDSNSLVPQYRLIYKKGNEWQTSNLAFRKTPFSLSGTGTKAIPIARPQIVAWQNRNSLVAALFFRDEELGWKVSVATTDDITNDQWHVSNLTNASVGSWEPSYDTELWKQKKIINLFVQNVKQVDGEGKANIAPQMVQVLEWKPK